MQTTLKELIEQQIFQSYDILTAKHHLVKPIESISILETPDFENYIIEKSLILTTFYPIKTDVETFKHLLYALNKKDTAGIVIKMKRYIDNIPEDILNLSEQLSIPIIALTYDANLSLLFNNILSELQTKDYTNVSFDTNYSQFLKQVYETPSTKTLMQIVEKIPDVELLIQNLDNKNTYYSHESLLTFFNQPKTPKNLFQRVGDTLYYAEDVVYDEKPIYRIVFMAKNEKRHILHNYIEIFKLMIIVIHQKKIENTLKQNQFLLNFVSNLSSSYTNQQLIEATKRYHWNVMFPVIMMLLSIKEKNKNVINPNMIEYIRTVIINKFHLNADELRYTIINDQLLFILNTLETIDLPDTIANVYELITDKYEESTFKLLYSNLIFEASSISKTYFMLSEALVHIENKNLGIAIYTEDEIRLLNLLKNIDYTHLKEYVQNVLGPVIAYEHQYNTPLIDTLYTHIACGFNARLTAEKLFIHYNSVRYRLDVLEQLGIPLQSQTKGHFDLYFALYLYKHFELIPKNH